MSFRLAIFTKPHSKLHCIISFSSRFCEERKLLGRYSLTVIMNIHLHGRIVTKTNLTFEEHIILVTKTKLSFRFDLSLDHSTERRQTLLLHWGSARGFPCIVKVSFQFLWIFKYRINSRHSLITCQLCFVNNVGSFDFFVKNWNTIDLSSGTHFL